MEQAVRRIACEQIAGAVRSIDEDDHAEAVHDVRKRCKKLRGLIRLVRPTLAAYPQENATFRDIARSISISRDASVLQDTVDHLGSHYRDESGREALELVRRHLARDSKQQAATEGVIGQLADCRDLLLDACDRAEAWELALDGWDAIGQGLAKTYARARKAFVEARETGTAEAHHELRKRIKYHWFHTRVLHGLWPEMMAVRSNLARELSDLLGLHHDLAVFEMRVAADRDAFGSTEVADIAISLATRRSNELERTFVPRVARLLSQKPCDLHDQWHALWQSWRG
ncbi:MAG: CHAD domain-containing protein [Novosphingobium sp.]|nr:CHAD domain-containing protein [Novosphingobium sp.]